MIEVLKQMVEALENSVDLVIEDAYNAEQLYVNVPTRQARVGGLKLLADEHQKAIQAGRQAIAGLESQEPVAVVDGDAHDIKVRLLIGGINLKPDTKLYTHPPQRIEPVCPECKAEVLYECVACSRNNYPPQRTESVAEDSLVAQKRTWVGLTRMELIKCGVLPFGMSYELCQAIEAKLKEKNT